MITHANNPILIAGGGIKIAGAEALCTSFAEYYNLPTTTTLNCIGLLPKSHPLNLGMLGMHGTPLANDALQASDLILAVGARFDDRATGKIETFSPLASVIHVDIDPTELNKNKVAQVAIAMDAKAFFASFNLKRDSTGDSRDQGRQDTETQNKGLADKRSADKISSDKGSQDILSTSPTRHIHAPEFIQKIGHSLEADTLVTVDVGQHQMWVAQYYPFSHAKQFLSSSGLGTMGFGLPAAIGAQIAKPNATVINFTGDGSFMMNVQELATVKRYKLPVKIVMFNNQHLGLVRQQQQLFYEKRYSQVDLSDNPDFAKLVEAFGFKTATIAAASEMETAAEWIKNESGPLFLEVKIPSAENVWPFVIPGQSNSNRVSQEEHHHVA